MIQQYLIGAFFLWENILLYFRYENFNLCVLWRALTWHKKGPGDYMKTNFWRAATLQNDFVIFCFAQKIKLMKSFVVFCPFFRPVTGPLRLKST